MPSSRNNRQSSGSGKDVQCAICSAYFSAIGIRNHRRSCERKHAESLQHQKYMDELQDHTVSKANQEIFESETQVRKPWENIGSIEPHSPDRTQAFSGLGFQTEPNIYGAEYTSTSSAEELPTLPAHEPSLGDVRIEYHPHTMRQPSIIPLDEYLQQQKRKSKRTLPSVKKPWKPFGSRSEFEFANVVLQAALTARQVDVLIGIMGRCMKGEDTFAIKDNTHLRRIWDEAKILHTPTEKHDISVPYKDKLHVYTFQSRSLWDWAMELVRNPTLAPEFEWDAKRLYRFNGTKFVRFIHEPYSANRFHEIQSALPVAGKPLVYLIYADVTKLSSFGTSKGYPVFARLGNLPIDIRNGNGLGGGELVGWLPFVEVDELEKNKKGYADHKRIVWHASFLKLLETIAQKSKTGSWENCGDNIIRLLFPLILILSADFEEQCVMTAIRGTKSLQPCPVCHVPHDELHNCAGSWKLRTAIETQQIVKQASKLPAGRSEALLKENGLRPVENSFWSVQFSDPHQTVSWDRMHSYSHGLGGKHLWPSLQLYIKAYGRDALKQVDDRAKCIPRWRGLNHFDKIIDIAFSDASKFEDILKLSIFITYGIINEQYPDGLLLLCCLRAYLNLDMYTGFNTQTEETIKSGREGLKVFSSLMSQYQEKSTLEPDKSWNIPKMHTHVHAFDDIEKKGATRNYNTKPNESMHGPLKGSYTLRSNFREYDDQILRADHCFQVATIIQSQIDALDGNFYRVDDDDENTPDISELESTKMKNKAITHFQNILLGAPQKISTFEDAQAAHSSDPAFSRLKAKFHRYLAVALPQTSELSRQMNLSSLQEYRYIKVTYECTVTWDVITDHLRCSPKFNNVERFDCVMVNTTDGIIFARLIFVFTTQMGDETFPWALIHPYDAAIGQVAQKEKDIQMYRLCAQPRSSAEFISARSIIRGVVLIPTFVKEGDYFIFDVLDSDIFMRVQKLWDERQ